MNSPTSAPPATLQPVSTTVDQEAIRAYAELTCDMNPIHLDAEFAAKTSMGGIIAHGTFSLNLIVQSLRLTFGDERLRELDLDVRFVRAVRPGDQLTAGGEQDAASANSYAVRVLNQHGEAVIEGTARLLAAA